MCMHIVDREVAVVPVNSELLTLCSTELVNGCNHDINHQYFVVRPQNAPCCYVSIMTYYWRAITELSNCVPVCNQCYVGGITGAKVTYTNCYTDASAEVLFLPANDFVVCQLVQYFTLLTKMCTSFNSVALRGYDTQHFTWSSDDVIWKDQTEWSLNIYKLTMCMIKKYKTASTNVHDSQSFPNIYLTKMGFLVKENFSNSILHLHICKKSANYLPPEDQHNN